MNKAIIFLGTVWAVVAGGCAAPPPTESMARPQFLSPDGMTATASSPDLMLTLHLPRSEFVTGDEFRVHIIATNRTDKNLRIRSRTGTPYVLKLYRHDGVGWRCLKTYPQASMTVMTDWVIPPGQSRTFEPGLLVEPDWPTYENLRLGVSLNGRDDVAPYVHVEVVQPKGAAKK